MLVEEEENTGLSSAGRRRRERVGGSAGLALALAKREDGRTRWDVRCSNANAKRQHGATCFALRNTSPVPDLALVRYAGLYFLHVETAISINQQPQPTTVTAADGFLCTSLAVSRGPNRRNIHGCWVEMGMWMARLYHARLTKLRPGFMLEPISYVRCRKKRRATLVSYRTCTPTNFEWPHEPQQIRPASSEYNPSKQFLP